jgi:GntR family negative regulator for fad regulon and positive regulator of fabA
MSQQPSRQRPSEYVENALVDAILEGTYPPGSCLPGERLLAGQLGVTRPTLREAIQRLARDGWLTVAHGKPTVVNDFWREGGLNVLGKLIEHPANLPGDFIGQLLEVRLHLAPAYTRAAVERASPQIAALLAECERLTDDSAAYARFDWVLHHHLTVSSGNPIYTLILNGFRGFYEEMARLYFTPAEARALSADFYRQLGDVAARADGPAAEALCRRVMQASIDLWRERAAGQEGE